MTDAARQDAVTSHRGPAPSSPGPAGRRIVLELGAQEREVVLRELARSDANHAKAARLLGVTDQALQDALDADRCTNDRQGFGETYV